MSERPKLPPLGKISPEFFAREVYPYLGARRPEVLTGPRHGVDVAIVRTAPGKVMAVTTDPIYILPWYGFAEAAWFAWHILASDVTTSGLAPAYVVVDFNLPTSITEEDFAAVWSVFHEESARYGAAVIAGHTARYAGTDYPMVGGATFLAVGDEDAYVTPEMIRAGDLLYMTKTAALEAAGIFGRLYRVRIEAELGPETGRRGFDLFRKMSTVDDALAAARFGLRDRGVSGMHDATECGVIGAAIEMADAAGTGLFLDRSRIVVWPEVAAICTLFGMAPEIAISEGTLLLAVREGRAGAFEAHMEAEGAPVTRIGRFLPPAQGRTDEAGGALSHPRVDPFWAAIERAAGR
jgi:hydrogenase maturation factor